MKRLALICALIAVSALGDGMPRARDGRGRWGRAGAIASTPAAPAGSWNACDQLQSGDKAGAWACMNGDTSSPAASALTFEGVNTVAHSGSSCASPPYQTTNTANGFTHSTTTFTSITTAQSLCVVLADDDVTVASVTHAIISRTSGYNILGLDNWNGGSPTWTSYFQAGGSAANPAEISTMHQGVRALACTVYDGAGTATLYVYFPGGPVTANSGSVTPQAITAELGFGGCTTGATADLTGKVYAGFYTAKALSSADVTRLGQKWVDCL